MLNLIIWHTSSDALIMSDVKQWREQISADASKTFIFDGYVPDRFDKYDQEARDLMQPGGLFGDDERTVTIWNAAEIANDELVGLLDVMDNEKGVTYHVALIRSTASDFVKAVYAHEPEEYDYALVDGDDPIGWMDEYLQEWSASQLSDTAFDYLSLAVMSDFTLAAEITAQLTSKLSNSADDESDELRIIDLDFVQNVVSDLGVAGDFELGNAIASGDIADAVNLSMRSNPNDIHGLLYTVRHRTLVAAMKINKQKLSAIQESFRDHKAEQAEIERKRADAERKNKEFTDQDADKVRKYKPSLNQTKYFFDQAPRYSAQQISVILQTVADTDSLVKRGGLSGRTVLEFSTKIAAINKAAKSNRKAKGRKAA